MYVRGDTGKVTKRCISSATGRDALVVGKFGPASRDLLVSGPSEQPSRTSHPRVTQEPSWTARDFFLSLIENDHSVTESALSKPAPACVQKSDAVTRMSVFLEGYSRA